MAIETPTNPADLTTDHPPAIDNELPAYRAISAAAIWSLVLGVISILGFAHWFFWIVAAVSVLCGWYALRSIRRYPDMYTGSGIARAGIVLATIFGLGSFTLDFSQGIVRKRKIEQFAREFEKVLNEGDIALAVWYYRPAELREQVNPKKMYDEFEKQVSGDPITAEQKLMPLKRLEARKRETNGQKIKFVEVEQEGLDETKPYGFLLYKFDAVPGKEEKFPETFASVYISGTEQGAFDWYVEFVRYPTKPRTSKLPDKPVDDGHGHGGEH